MTTRANLDQLSFEEKRYSFPVSSEAGTCLDIAELRHVLLELVPQITSHHDYAKVRDRWCALHIALNEDGRWAPAYRPWPKLPQKPREQCEDRDHNLQRDRIMIDTHWLHSRSELVNVEPKRAPKWQRLFDPAEPFDFELAEQFAQQVWTDDFRTGEVLCLTTFQQSQMGAMRTKTHKQHMESFYKATYGSDRKRIAPPAAVVRVAVAEWKERQPNLGDPNRLMARAEAQYYLRGAASSNQVARLAGLIVGEPPQSAKTVLKSLAGLRKRLPSVMAERLGRGD